MPVWRSYSKGEFRSIIGSSIIGIWTFFREMGLIERSERIVFSTILWSRTSIHVSEPHNAPRWFKCIRPEHPAHGGVMLCTVHCRPVSTCARESLKGCTLKKQDKTRLIKVFTQSINTKTNEIHTYIMLQCTICGGSVVFDA